MSDAAALAAAAAATPSWFAAADDEIKGFFQNRGLDKKTAPEAALQLAKDFRETQSKLAIPADRVLRIPDPTDAEGWKAVHQKLGVPADPAAYDFSAVKHADGTAIDDSLSQFMRSTAQALNLPKDTAPQLAAAIVKFREDADASRKTTEGVARAVAIDALNASWGANRETNKFVADRTATLLGLTPDFVAAVPADLYAGFMEKLREAGSRMGEATLLGHGSGGGGPNQPMTREGAVARLAELRTDKAFYARLMEREPAALQEWNNLNKLSAGQR